ncbi:uncharacterized protein [Nicotiana sylvestris]|uniref:uncharacterized protein n=1 Tax=Nicotiana sylvestris TaxID=4096 RepID=UPI00388CBD90
MDVQALASQFMRLDLSEPSRVIVCVVSGSSLLDRIREHQFDDPHLLFLKDKVLHGDARDVTIGDDGVLRMQGRICVPNVDGLQEMILEEGHSSRCSIHPGAVKMYQDLRQYYWWRRMKEDIIGFVTRCLNCQQVQLQGQLIEEATWETKQDMRSRYPHFFTTSDPGSSAQLYYQ